MQNNLHPAWFHHEQGQPTDNPDLEDTLTEHFDHIAMLGELLNQQHIELSPTALRRLGWHLTLIAKEGDALIEAIGKHGKPSLHSIGGES